MDHYSKPFQAEDTPKIGKDNHRRFPHDQCLELGGRGQREQHREHSVEGTTFRIESAGKRNVHPAAMVPPFNRLPFAAGTLAQTIAIPAAEIGNENQVAASRPAEASLRQSLRSDV